MSRDVRANRGGRSRVTGPIGKSMAKGDVAVGRGVSNDYKHGGPVDPEVKEFLKVATPVISPGSGPVAKNFTANLTNPEEGALYKYTIDDSSPAGASALTLVNDQVNLTLTGDPAILNFKIHGEKLDYGDSEIVDIDYTLQPVKDVEILPASGYAPDNQLITLITEASSSTRYTLDGSVPSGGSGYLYSLPFVINFSGNAPIDVKAISTRTDFMDSQIAHATYLHQASLDYGGPYNGVRDKDGRLVNFSPAIDRVPFPSKVFLSASGNQTDKDISFWGTAAYVENNLPSHKNKLTNLSAGENHVIGLTTGNLVVAWGDNSYGQTTLTTLPTDGSVSNISAGDNHNLALVTNGDVHAWGDDSQNQSSVPDNLKAIRIAAGGEHSLALKPDRTVVGWGNNDDGQRDFPLNLNDVTEISAGENHSTAIIGYGSKTCDQFNYINGEWKVVKKSISVGKVVAWGIDDLNQSTAPTDLTGAPDIIAISCGGNHTLALDASYDVHAWGDNGFGQCTIPAFEEPNGDTAQILAISAGFAHSMALSKEGTVFTWGANQFGQSNITNLLGNVTVISAGNNYSLAYGFEPAEHIYYSTGSDDPGILYTEGIQVAEETTIHAISRNKVTNAASNKTSKTYKQEKFENVDSFGLVSSRCDDDPLQTGVFNPALFTSETPFAVKIIDSDKSKDPTVNITISNPQSGTSLDSNNLAVDDADCKKFSSLLISGDTSKAFDGDKTIDNYLSFYPGGYIGYRFDEPKRITKVDFATNANDQHKLGAGLVQGSTDGVNWKDVSFFSNKFPKNYPPFLSLDGQPIDRVTSLQLDGTGIGYVSNPTVNFQSLTLEGENAAGYALFPEFSLTGFKVNTPGMKYATAPNVEITPVAVGGDYLAAAGQAVLTDRAIVHGVTLSNAGAGYVFPPTVTLSGGGESVTRTATATTKLVPTVIGGINILSNTTPYESVPTIAVDNTNAGGQDAEFLTWLSSVSAGSVLREDYGGGEYGGGGTLPKGLLVGTGDNYPPLGYHTYDGVAVPDEGDVPSLSNIGNQKTTLYRIDHFDVSNAGSNYTAPPVTTLEGGITEDIWPITPSERAFAVMMTVVMRGPDNEKLLPSPPANETYWKGLEINNYPADTTTSVARRKGDVGLFINDTAAMRSVFSIGSSLNIGGAQYSVVDHITDGTHGEGFKIRHQPSASYPYDGNTLYEAPATANLDLTGVTAVKWMIGFTATAVDDLWTFTNHGFVNGTSIVGDWAAVYYVGNVSTNTFKLYTDAGLTNLLDVSADISNYTFSVSIWTKAGHDLSNGQSVILTAMGSGTGPTVGNQYFVEVLTVNTFRLYLKTTMLVGDLIDVTANISGATIQTGSVFYHLRIEDDFVSNFPLGVAGEFSDDSGAVDGYPLIFDSMDSGGGPVAGTTYYIKNAVWKAGVSQVETVTISAAGDRPMARQWEVLEVNCLNTGAPSGSIWTILIYPWFAPSMCTWTGNIPSNCGGYGGVGSATYTVTEGVDFTATSGDDSDLIASALVSQINASNSGSGNEAVSVSVGGGSASNEITAIAKVTGETFVIWPSTATANGTFVITSSHTGSADGPFSYNVSAGASDGAEYIVTIAGTTYTAKACNPNHWPNDLESGCNVARTNVDETDEIRDKLVELINADSSQTRTAAGTASGELTITADVPGTAFTIAVAETDTATSNSISVANATPNDPREDNNGYFRLYTDSGLTTLLEVSSAITNAAFRTTYEVTASATTDLWSYIGHNLIDGEPLKYEGQTSGTGPVIGTTYYVKSISANSFELYTDQALTSLVDITVDVVGAWLTSPTFSLREDHSLGTAVGLWGYAGSQTRTSATFAERSVAWRNLDTIADIMAGNYTDAPHNRPLIYSFFEDEKAILPSNSNGGHDLHKFFREGHRLYHLRFHKNAALSQKVQVVGGGGAGMGGYIELRNHNELLGFEDVDSLTDKLIALNRTSSQGGSGPAYSNIEPADISYEELLMSTPRELGGQLPDDDATLIPYKLHITGLGDGYTSAPTITEEFDRMYPGMMYILESGGMQINTTGRLSNGLHGYDELTDWGGDYVEDTMDNGHYAWSGFSMTTTSEYLSDNTIYIQGGVDTIWDYQVGGPGGTIKQNLKLVVPEVVSTGGMFENDMHNADSPERAIFENQLANLITFESIFPKQSEIDVFLEEGIVDKVEMIDMGDGYTTEPDVVFAGGHAPNATNPVTAVATAAISKGIERIDLTPYGNGLFMSGSGYLSFPEIKFLGGGGEGASATALAAPSHITGLVLTNPGSGYTQAPAVSFMGGDPSVPAEASCRLPVASSQTTFTNDELFNYYRVVGHGDNDLVNCQVNEIEFYSGNNRIYDYSNMNDHTLVIDSHGKLTSWGDNTHQQSAFSTGVTNALSVSAGRNHSLVLKDNGTVICFGDNAYGQANVPDHLNNVTSVSAGYNHNLSLLAGGTVASWGRNHSGQCNTPESLLVGKSGNHGAISAIAGGNHSLALLANGTVTGWGGAIPSAVPPTLSGVKEIAAGEHFSLALKNNGKVQSWGGGYGVNVPSNLKNVVSIAACNDHALALKVDGTVTSWGQIYDGVSWVNLAVPSEINTPIPTNTNPAIRVYAGKSHGSILRKDGSMVVFGKICENEYHPTGLLPTALQTSACCNTIGYVAFDLGQTYNTPLATNEYLQYRSRDISSQLSNDDIFAANTGQSTVRVEMIVSGAGYLNSDTVTGEYPLLKLSPKVTPETNAAFGPTITIPNWDQESQDNLNVLYTLDGTDPVDGAGTVYSSALQPNDGEFVLVLPLGTPPNGYNDDTTIKVYAESDVYLNSDVLSYEKQQLAAPTINIADSGNILTITMSIGQPTDESRVPAIYYTLSSVANDTNLLTPTENDYIYTAPVNLNAAEASVKAKGFLVGYKPSDVTVGNYP